MDFQTMMDRFVELLGADYSEDVGMLFTREKSSRGKHHAMCRNGLFAEAVLCHGYEAHYEKALQIVEKLCDLQDVRPGSKTFGLWSTIIETPLDEMFFHDYNRADFVGRFLQEIYESSRCPLSEELRQKMRTAIRNAAICSIGRNSGLDYTNIIALSCFTITHAGELLGDGEIFAIGKERLKRFLEYTRYTTSFSEYNSSCYVLTMMDGLYRMIKRFRDPECVQMGQELSFHAWKMLATHYNDTLKQLTPPQCRSYDELESGVRSWYIYQGTGGRFGEDVTKAHFEKIMLTNQEYFFTQMLSPLGCPEEVYPYFAEKERFFAHTYYKPNTIRREDEDLTIIREMDSPELVAYSWQTEKLSMGAFRFCDTWEQRLNCMVIWDREHPKCFRIRGMEGDRDFCSGIVHADQEHGRILGHVGLVSDRGSRHYIQDVRKDGVYETDGIYFQFQLGGDCEGLTIRQSGKDFTIRDGEMTIRLQIAAWVWDGKEAPVYVSEDGRSVILEGYRGETTLLDTTKLGPTYGVFTLTAEYPGREAETADLAFCAENGKVTSSWGSLQVSSHTATVPYRKALGLDLNAEC